LTRTFVLILILLCCPFALKAQEISSPLFDDTPDISSNDTGLVSDTIRFIQEVKDSIKINIVMYSFDDSAYSYTLGGRFNGNGAYRRSLGHDASHFLKFNPSNFLVTNLSTPNRTTNAPFNVNGNRYSVIFNKKQINPLDHVTGPDNMIDFNDIPTGPVQDFYNIEGPLGSFLGANNGVSSLILKSYEPKTVSSESKMVADVGSYGYAYTKGLFTHRNAAGRSIKASVSYRKADGIYGYDDETYHQWAEIVVPFKNKFKAYFEGRMYDREGLYPFETNASAIDRTRLDRDFSAGIDWLHNNSSTSKIRFRTEQSESNNIILSESYLSKIETYDRSLSFTHSQKAGTWDLIFDAVVDQQSYKDTAGTAKRYGGLISFKTMIGAGKGRFLTLLKINASESRKPLPSAMAGYVQQGENHYLSLAIGTMSKYPRLYELNLSENRFISQDNYMEIGNKYLLSEKQITGNLTYALGGINNDTQLSITAGSIKDGVDWSRIQNGDTTEYTPVNSDIKFANLTLRKNINWNNWLIISGGGSYRYNEINDNETPPYSPNYQLFGTLQIHKFIEKLGLNLFAYGEVLYNSQYSGYNNDFYGQGWLIRLKPSNFEFEIKEMGL